MYIQLFQVNCRPFHPKTTMGDTKIAASDFSKSVINQKPKQDKVHARFINDDISQEEDALNVYQQLPWSK